MNKELKRLGRRELLEILVRQQQENEALTARVTSLEQQLQERRIAIVNAGSLAEAALTLNGVFADADKAAAQYVENMQRCSEECKKTCEDMILAAERRAEEIISAAESEKRRITDEADACREQISRSPETSGFDIQDLEDLFTGVQ